MMKFRETHAVYEDVFGASSSVFSQVRRCSSGNNPEHHSQTVEFERNPDFSGTSAAAEAREMMEFLDEHTVWEYKKANAKVSARQQCVYEDP